MSMTLNLNLEEEKIIYLSDHNIYHGIWAY